MLHKKLFIPGPTEVSDEILKAVASPMIGHRSKEFAALYASIQPKIQKTLYTQNKVFLSTSSSTGLFEAATRNCVKNKCLHLTCGNFSELWYKLTLANGKQADAYSVEWGLANKAEVLKEKIESGQYDTVMLVHSETSTGVLNPLEKMSEVMKQYPEIVFCVDTVSSLTAQKIEVDKLGIDICLAGVQKAFALPPGLAIASVSQKVLDRAKDVPNRGYYFDFIEWDKHHAKNNTPSTPAIPQMFGLDKQLDNFFNEGLDNRYARHERLRNMCHKWVKEQGFELFPEKGYEAIALSCIKNTKNYSIEKLNEELGKRGFMISNGYSKLKELTFRIAHMGDTTEEGLKELLDNIDDILAKM